MAMPSKPRSLVKFTCTSSTLPACSTSEMTRRTCPVSFSSTRMSFAARKAMVVG
jgi:hypothetical protein